MGRIRTIKPEFWKNEGLSELTESTHLIAAALLNYADDEGYFNANEKLILAECSPLREPSTNIRRTLDELSRVGYLRLGKCEDGREYGHIIKFKEHQRVDRPKPSKIKDLQIDWNGSTNNRRTIDEQSTEEGNREQGKERKGIGSGIEKKTAREENLESVNLSQNPIPPQALVGNPFVESYSAPVWLRKVFGELYEEATGQFVICSGIEVAKAKEFFSVLSQLNPGADEKEIYERAKLGAEIAFEGYMEGTGYFHWLDKSPPEVGWFANNAPQVNLAVTARLNMTEEEIEQEREIRETYERVKNFADEVDAQVEKDLAEGRKPLSGGLGLPKPRTEH